MKRESILAFLYYEHFKYAKELALCLPVEHPKRIYLHAKIEEIHSEWIKEREANSQLSLTQRS